MKESLGAIAKMIDHSLLHPVLTDADLRRGCEVAVRCDVAAVCIKPYAVPLATEVLSGSDVKVGTVVGFPHGNSRTDVKIREADLALDDGAVELDMVVNIGKVLGGDWDYVSREIRELNEVVAARGGILKVIFENDYLDENSDKVRLCRICDEQGVAFVKTSTGFGFVKRDGGMYSYDGAVDSDLRLMREVCGAAVQVKAAGRVRTLDDVLRVRSLGVTRVGATATEAILQEARGRGYS